MGRRYLGGGGSALTVWISIAASTVLVFYGYDQVRLSPKPQSTSRNISLIHIIIYIGSIRKCHYRRGLPPHNGISLDQHAKHHDIRLQPGLFCGCYVDCLDRRCFWSSATDPTRKHHYCSRSNYPGCFVRRAADDGRKSCCGSRYGDEYRHGGCLAG